MAVLRALGYDGAPMTGNVRTHPTRGLALFLLFVGSCLALLSLSPSSAQHIVRMVWGVGLLMFGGWILVSGNAAALVRGALVRSARGDVAGARALLDEAEKKYPWLVGPNVGLQRALMALRGGDPGAAESHAGRVLMRRRTGLLADAARGVRALSRAERCDAPGARDDAALVRASVVPHAAPRAHAELAEALLLAHEGRTNALRAHLARYAFLLYGYLPSAQRATVAKVWAGAYVETPPEGALAPESAAPLALRPSRGRAGRAVVFGLTVSALLAMALVLRRSAAGRDLAVYLVGGAALVGLFSGLLASARHKDTKLEIARVLIALGDFDAAKRELQDVLATKNRVLGAMAELELAKLADRRADFEASLVLCQHALLALSSKKRVVAADLLAAELLALKAHALVALDRTDEARVFLEAAGRLRHRSEEIADTLVRVTMIEHARREDWTAVKTLAVAGEITDPRTELLAQAAAAIDQGDAARLFGLHAWLHDWPLGAAWLVRAVPVLGDVLRRERQSS
jgi:tetratricopeptide (TPR) repeat protein